jgi:hypothetical protein
MDENKIDAERFEALEEVTYHTSNAFEALLNVLVEKGVISERELLDKMDSLVGIDDAEELGFDADAPRDQDTPE